MISRNSVIAVCTPLTVVSRSSLMSVIITFMFEPAKLQMNWASASGRIRRRAAATERWRTGAPLAATRSSVTWIHTYGYCRQEVPALLLAGSKPADDCGVSNFCTTL